MGDEAVEASGPFDPEKQQHGQRIMRTCTCVKNRYLGRALQPLQSWLPRDLLTENVRQPGLRPSSKRFYVGFGLLCFVKQGLATQSSTTSNSQQFSQLRLPTLTLQMWTTRLAYLGT